MTRTSKPKRRARRPRKAPSQGRMWPWYLAAVVVVGGITIYDNRQRIEAWTDSGKKSQIASQEPARKPDVQARTASVSKQPTTLSKPSRVAPETVIPKIGIPKIGIAEVPVPADRVEDATVQHVGPSTMASPAGKFFYCSPSRADNCVIDGDTFVFKGEKIRVADIEAPKARQARCDSERLLAHDAKERLRILLSAGDFTLAASPQGSGDTDRGTARRVIRNGQSLGEQMAAEGIVQKRDGKRWPWCRQS
ncbi:thermonuclease family protein [Pararhizobium antarcticum]|uniref:Nuclease n=1 Tax=Pararhizobium antarcticum TaxID=1798805 RepID=A0A657LXS8_9HYPH|nr:hypothetical protein [Pararhizobium antarcticum]OJF91052.1 hypothetical protein AX761_06215 [Rhizobium sp. 58]OJF99981.1 hypothetical protein AX760_11390 [Pararhizobium antarcticum]